MFRSCDIDFDNKYNTPNLLNKQTWLKTNETVDIDPIEMKPLKRTNGVLILRTIGPNVVKNELHYSIDKFGIGTEKFSLQSKRRSMDIIQEIKQANFIKFKHNSQQPI